MSLQKNIRDLVHFYVQTNYNEYLKNKQIRIIPEEDIDSVITSLYDDREDHIKVFIIESLLKLYENKMNEYPGDQIITNILLNIFQDDELCKNRVCVEIIVHQKQENNL